MKRREGAYAMYEGGTSTELAQVLFVAKYGYQPREVFEYNVVLAGPIKTRDGGEDEGRKVQAD